MASYNLYIADGTEVTYAYTFDMLSTSEIEVRLNNTVQTTGYTINDVTKTVTFDTAPASGLSVMLRRKTPVELLYRFGQGAAFTGQNLDADFDQLLYGFEEYSDITDYSRSRTLRVPDSDPEISVIGNVEERAGKYLGFDSLGNPQLLLPDADSAAGVAAELSITNLNQYEIQKRLAVESGFLLSGKFETGQTLTTVQQSLLYRAAGVQYAWTGAYPKTVFAGQTPMNSGGIGPGAWVEIKALRTELGEGTGADLVKYQHKVAVGALPASLANRFVYQLDAVADFGADPTNSVDSAAALQSFASACQAVGWVTGHINGLFKISAPVTWLNVAGLNLVCNAYIYPTYNTGDYVLGFCNSQGIRIGGKLEVSGQSKLGIQCGLKFWTTTSNGVSFSSFYGLAATDVLCGIQCGDVNYPDGLVSEMEFVGGYTAGTPCAVRVIGTQTYVCFIGFDAVSGGPGALSVVTQYTVHVKGANLKWIGGEIQHNDNIAGAATLVEPVTSAAYSNPWGNLTVSDCHVETAAALCLIANLDSIPTPLSDNANVTFRGLRGYHSQNNGPFISVHSSANTYAGRITTDEINMYCGVVRNQPNIQAPDTTHVYYDPAGFGKNFVKGLQAVSGGILHFPRRIVFRATNANSQAIGTSAGVVNFTQPQVSDDQYRWNTNYSAGRFTVPPGGLNDVTVDGTLRVASGNLQLDVYVDSTLKTLSSPSATIAHVHADLGNLNAGQIVDIRATASASTTTNGGSLEFITITAER